MTKLLAAAILAVIAAAFWRHVWTASTPELDDTDWYAEGWRDVAPWQRA
jgi:hypothetical protein